MQEATKPKNFGNAITHDPKSRNASSPFEIIIYKRIASLFCFFFFLFQINYLSDPSPEELPAPTMASSSSTLMSKGDSNQSSPIKEVNNLSITPSQNNAPNSPPFSSSLMANPKLTSGPPTVSDSEYVQYTYSKEMNYIQ